MQLLIQVSMHAHFIAFLKNALVDQLLFFSPSRVSQRFWGTREHELILGNKGTKLYKSEEKNILSKFMKYGYYAITMTFFSLVDFDPIDVIKRLTQN